MIHYVGVRDLTKCNKWLQNYRIKMTAFVIVAAIITAISTQSSISSPRGNDPNTESVCNVRRFHECFTVYLPMFGKPRMRGVEGTNQHRYQTDFCGRPTRFLGRRRPGSATGVSCPSPISAPRGYRRCCDGRGCA